MCYLAKVAELILTTDFCHDYIKYSFIELRITNLPASCLNTQSLCLLTVCRFLVVWLRFLLFRDQISTSCEQGSKIL